MATFPPFRGYREEFLGSHVRVPLPELAEGLQQFVAPVKHTEDNVLRYHNYSVIQHAGRRFPFLTAANINGGRFFDIRRKDIFKNGNDRWRKDPRISYKHQWGAELYGARKSDFDRGHMTKREDVQWGATKVHAKLGAQTTFFYPNSVPQARELNQVLWRSLEDYILHEETLSHGMKVNVFTGPLLMDDDPEFVTEVRRVTVQLPRMFWKMIYYSKRREELSRVAFLVGQEDILVKKGIVKPLRVTRGEGEENPFQDFKLGDTFQVHPSFIEDMTGFTFVKANEPFEDFRPVKIILEEVELPLNDAARTRGGPAALRGASLRRTRGGAVQRTAAIKGIRL